MYLFLEENELYAAIILIITMIVFIFSNDLLYILLEELVYNKVNKILTEPKKFSQRAKILNIQGLVLTNT